MLCTERSCEVTSIKFRLRVSLSHPASESRVLSEEHLRSVNARYTDTITVAIARTAIAAKAIV